MFGRTLFTGVLMSVAAMAAPVTFSGSNGSGLSAQAVFDVAGSQLQVLLVNTSSEDVRVPSQVLTGLFWNMADSNGNNVTLNPISATVNTGSDLIWCFSCDADISDHWAYGSNVAGFNHGVGASGLGGVFGARDTISGDWQSPQGIDWGIVSEGDNPWTGNGGIWSGLPLVKNAVLFNFTFSESLSGIQFSDIRFQYGSNICEPSFPGDPNNPTPTPEPASFAMLGAGMVTMSGWMIRRKRKQQVQ